MKSGAKEEEDGEEYEYDDYEEDKKEEVGGIQGRE